MFEPNPHGATRTHTRRELRRRRVLLDTVLILQRRHLLPNWLAAARMLAGILKKAQSPRFGSPSADDLKSYRDNFRRKPR
jgi:hypothetical protein